MDALEQIQKNLERMTGHMGTLAESQKGINDRLDSHDERFDKMEAEAAAFKAQVEKSTAAGKTRGVSVPGSELKNDGRKFSFLNACRGIITGSWKGAEYEREVFRISDEMNDVSKSDRVSWQRSLAANDFEIRDMTTGDDILGGFIVPTQILASEFIELLRPEIVVEAMGARVLDDLDGAPVEIPKQVGGASASWTPENSLISDSDVSLGSVNLTPRQLAAMVKLSNRLLRLSTPSAEAMVREDMARKIAEKFDLAALRGSGASGEPLGIANVVGINSVALGANGGRLTLNDADLMRDELANDDALRGTTGYVMHPKTLGRLRRERIAQFSSDSGGFYMNLPMTNASMQEQLNDPFRATTQIPINLTKGSGTDLSEVYFANWRELLIGMWLRLELQASQDAGESFQRNQTWIKATMEGDVQVRHPESFCLISDAQTQDP